MSLAEDSSSSTSAAIGIDDAVERACARIAPTWPLDRFIAVNPFWSRIEKPLPAVSAELTSLSGARLLMPRAWFREQWQQGRLRPQHLRMALAQTGSPKTEAQLLELLESDAPAIQPRARVMDVLDQHRDLSHAMAWRDFVTNSTSQLCASYFDEGQAQLEPDRDGGLYVTWLRHACADRTPALLMGLRNFNELARRLPATPRAMIELALVELDIPPRERETYLTGLLLDLNGWASWCAYRRWTARLGGGEDDHIVDLLAIRLAWECLLLRTGGRSLAAQWQVAMSAWAAADVAALSSQADDWLLQKALEISWQQEICRQLPAGLSTPAPTHPTIQAVFCIDVRSEVFRRALETESAEVQTLGFAGFFGMPIAYQPLASLTARPQLPGLLEPNLRVTDVGVPDDLAARRAERLDVHSAWRKFKTSAVSSFSFVEAMGLFFGGKLLADAFGRRAPAAESAGLSAQEHAARKPRLTSRADGSALDLEARVALAAGMLKAMSLTRDFAELVVLLGHGSETRNNPHAAGLDCGACCGQTGEVNARAAAALLNEPEVRQGLAKHGIDVPEHTHFVAGLHNTTIDHVRLFDLDELPSSREPLLANLLRWLAGAGERARAERARGLALDATEAASLQTALNERATDWAQVRPEWGLANNAGFIVAPREHCKHMNLGGRAFLHDYRHEQDEGFAVLELIMTAPMIVTHWINLQYYASTVDQARYGSGNKVLHNVVGGHIGVFEGNGGDLRIGLPLQSVHDGERWVHTPVRSSVFIEAPRAAIDLILEKHAHVRDLVDNDWLSLFQMESGTIHAYRQKEWVDVTGAGE